MAFLNRCIWTATSSGTGPFVVNNATQNGYIPANCLEPPVIDGATYHYFAQTAIGEHEEGDGVYTVSSATLTRATVRNSSNGGSLVNFSLTPTVFMGGPSSNDIRTVLTGNVTYNVSPSGNDVTGDGSVGKPWATPQRASDYISQSVDLAGYTVFINCAANPNPGYPSVFMGGFFSSRSSRAGVDTAVVFVGDNTTPSNVWCNRWVLGGPSVPQVYLSGFHIAANANGAFLSSVRASPSPGGRGVGTIQIGHPSILNKMEFDASDSYYTLEGNIGFSGCAATLNCTVNSPDGFYFGTSGAIGAFEGSSLAITGTANWGTAFIRQDIDSYSEWFLGFSGTANGTRFICQALGELFANGNTEYFPGSSPGIVGSLGSYVNGAIAHTSSGESPSITGITAIADAHINYQTPATGFSITPANTDGHLILDPSGTLATGTVTMAAHPLDGQIINIRSSQTVTGFTLAANTGQSMKGAPTTLTAGQELTVIYRAANTTWYAGV